MRAKHFTGASRRAGPGLRRSGIGLAALSAVLAPSIGHAADACHRTSDEKSVYMRSLQTDLMVAALTCSANDQYNDFVHKFQALLKTDADHLRGYYKKKHGKAGAEELNTFVTRLANDESERSIQQGQSAYCENATKLFQSALALAPGQLEDYAITLPISSEAPVKPCASSAAQEKPKPAAAASTPLSNGGSATVPAADAPVSTDSK